jgi:ATP-binding cassette, subfamily B, bacterial
MHDHLRTAKLVLTTAYGADPWRTVGGIFLEGVGMLGPIFVGVSLKFVIDGVLEHRAATVVLGSVGLFVVPSFSLLADGLGHRLRMTMAERAKFAFERRYVEVAAALRTLTHHEHPEFRNKLELLQQNQQILASAVNGLIHTLAFLVQAAGTFVVVASIHPLLLLLVVFGVPTVIVTAMGQRWLGEVEDETAADLRRARHLYETSANPGAAKELRVFGLEDEIVRRHTESYMRVLRRVQPVQWRVAFLNTTGFVAFAVGFIGAIVFVTLRAITGASTAGDVVMTITVAGQMNSVVSSGASRLAWVAQSLRYAGRFRWLLDHAERERTTQPGRPAPTTLQDGIRFEHVDFTYPATDRAVLRDVSLHLPAGSVIALVGENGAGKTTLVKLLCRFYDPSAGRITVDGNDLVEIDCDGWRERAAAGFQDFAKIELVVQESVGVGDLPRIGDDAAVIGALERAGASDVLTKLPSGLDTQLGRAWADGVDLSGGEWQKLALGRALMRERPLLTILDEPTATLDAETEHLLFERYAAQGRERREDGAITILVSHRFSTVSAADVIVVLNGGRVDDVGTHEELMSHSGLYAELYSIQARAYR